MENDNSRCNPPSSSPRSELDSSSFIPHPSSLAGVVLDLDGVLVTTDRFHYQAWKELADELGLAFDEEVNHQLRGVSREESLRLIYRHNRRALPPPAELTAQCRRKNNRYVQLVGQMTAQDVLPGSVELLSSLRRAGIKTAVASASKNAPLVLARTGLGRFMDAVADGNSATASKPDPQVFLVAAQRLGCRPVDCIGIEDAAVGIEAIHRAGMVAVGIGPAAQGADLLVAGVHELTVERLRRVFGEQTQKRAT